MQVLFECGRAKIGCWTVRAGPGTLCVLSDRGSGQGGITPGQNPAWVLSFGFKGLILLKLSLVWLPLKNE